MPISPFIDRKENDLSKVHKSIESVTIGVTTTGNKFKHAQGVSIKTNSDDRTRLIPLLSTNGYPQGESQVINHQRERTFFGEILLFETSGEVEGFYPFEDISSGRDPVSFLKDDGITAYPQVMLNPNYLDPGMMNGIIEPLEVRGTLPGASVDSPFVAHTTRGFVDTSPDSYVHQPNTDPAKNELNVRYIDSQDSGLSISSFRLSIPGIADFGLRHVAPFDDSGEKIKIENDLKFQDESDFNDSIGVGIISKGATNTVFDYERGRSVARGKTGIRNVSNVDSLAFGGLTR